MNERGMTRVSKDHLAEMIDETAWARVDAMTEADIERAAAEDPDTPMTAAGDWEDARIVWPPTTEPVTLRLDRECSDGFGGEDGAIRRASMRCFAPLSTPTSASRPARSLRPRYALRWRVSDLLRIRGAGSGRAETFRSVASSRRRPSAYAHGRRPGRGVRTRRRPWHAYNRAIPIPP